MLIGTESKQDKIIYIDSIQKIPHMLDIKNVFNITIC